VREPWLPAEHGSETGPLERHVARGLTWTIANAWGIQALNLVVFVILARLLVPADFGLVALAVVFVAFAQLLVDQGLGDALVQRREVTRSHIDTAFWVSVTTGCVLTVLGIGLAIPIAAVLREPELRPILQVLSLTFVLAALSSIQIALLRREFAFRSLAVRGLVAAAGGGMVGVALAYSGHGAWALVGQLVAAAALSVITLWWVSPWRPGFQASRRDFRELFGFGINVVGSDVLGFLSRNVDNLLIAVFLGTTPLGIYAVGYRILETSQKLLINIARKLTFPAFSRLQEDPDRMKRAYFRVTRAGGAVIMPGYVALALVAPELTIVLFGERWAASGWVAAVLFLIGPVLSMQAFSGALLNAAGHPEVVFRFRLITTVVNVAGFLAAVSFGVVAVAAAFVIRGYLLLPLNLRWMQIYGGIPVREYLGQLRGVALATSAMVAVVIITKYALVGRVTLDVLLIAEVAAGASSFLAALWLVDRDLVGELLQVGRQAVPGRNRGARREANLTDADSGGAMQIEDV
jgi:O-antigen/teichoic acid export membrane protein